MPLFNRILFPVDFSPRCLEAAPFVAAMARHYGAEITVLHAFDAGLPGFLPMGVSGAVPAQAIQEITAWSREQLNHCYEDHFEGLAVHRELEVGDPATIICEHAQKSDLVMMPTHGYGPFRQFLLGSVTAKVLHDVDRPVWTNAHTPKPYVYAKREHPHFICAIDGREECVPLMQWAAEFARDHDAKLWFVHAIPFTAAAVEDGVDDNVKSALVRYTRERINRLQEIAGVGAHLCVHFGDVAHVVADVARQHQANLTILGRGTIQQTFGGLKTHAHAIIRESPCPVLTM